MNISDEIPHVKFDMTPERKQRFAEVSRQIVDLVCSRLSALEAVTVLELVMKSINENHLMGTYRGSFFVGDRTMEVNESKCPGCETTLSLATEPGGHKPEPGDVTICAHCGEILIFDESLHVSRPNPVQLEAIKGDGRVMAMSEAVTSAAKHRATVEKLSKSQTKARA